MSPTEFPLLRSLGFLVLLPLLPGCGGGASSDAGTDGDPGIRWEAGTERQDASVQPGRDAGLDAGRRIADAGPLSPPDIGAWIDAINAQETALCRCSYSGLGFETREQCALAHGVGPEPRSCAVAHYEPYREELGHSTACSTLILQNFATCVEQLPACTTAGLAICEEGRALAAGDCPDASSQLEVFFGEVGDCARGTLAGCPNDIDSVGAVGPAAWVGNTFQNGDDHQLSCALGRGTPDRSLRWRVPADAVYSFDTLGSSFDTSLGLLRACGGVEIACNDDVEETQWTSEVNVELLEGTEIIIVVDGYNEFSSGQFVVNITPH